MPPGQSDLTDTIISVSPTPSMKGTIHSFVHSLIYSLVSCTFIMCQAAFQMLEIQQEAEQTIIAASVSLSFSRAGQDRQTGHINTADILDEHML